MTVFKHTGAAIRPFGLGAGEFSELDQIPEFHQAWSEVAAQVQHEGGSGLELDAAKRSLISSYTDLVSHQIGVDPRDALSAAKKYVLAANTVAGAIQNVSGLIQAAQSGAPTAALIQSFTGTLVGTMVVAAGLSAGVGAAIVGGVALAVGVLDSLGLFAGRGTEVCPGVRCDPPPKWLIGCTCVWAERVVSPQSPFWRRFPSATNPADAEWFGRLRIIEWAGGSFGTGASPRPIDATFPEYALLECESQHLIPGVPGEFQKAFYAAWKANKEYALNGLKPAEDWQVLLHTVRIWNRSHAPGAGYVFTSAPKTLVYGSECPAQFRAYEAMLVDDILRNSNDLVHDAPGGAVKINTGSMRSATMTRRTSAALSSIFNSSPPPMSTGAKVVAGVAGTSLLAVAGLYAYSKVKGIAFDTAVSRFKHRFIAKENPLFLPESTSNLSSSRSRHSTSRGRRLAWRVRVDLDPVIEAVILMPDGSARLYRQKRLIARFMPSHYQYAKIRAGYGEILVYADQLM